MCISDRTITNTDFSTGELIPNCGIEILDESKNVLVQGRTDDKGEVTFKRLPMGNYYYREFDAPKGYYLDPTPVSYTHLYKICGESGYINLGKVFQGTIMECKQFVFYNISHLADPAEHYFGNYPVLAQQCG